jgi:hypothetical protein
MCEKFRKVVVLERIIFYIESGLKWSRRKCLLGRRHYITIIKKAEFSLEINFIKWKIQLRGCNGIKNFETLNR